MKEKHQICALCNGSIHNNHSSKYETLKVISEDKTLYRKTDMFAIGIEENFKNNHYICVDCIIKRFAPIQLLIDDIILRSNIIKYMPLDFEERKRLILSEN